MNRPSLKHVLLLCAALFFGTWMAYGVIANFLLTSGILETTISRHPDRIRLTWDRAWTVFPGHLRITGFSMIGQTPRWQYKLAIDRGRLQIGLRDLLARRFSAKYVKVDHLVLHMRRQRIPGEANDSNRNFEAPLPELPALRPDPSLLTMETPSRPPWQVILEQIEVETVEEFWWGPYRMRGEGSLQGAMKLRIHGPLEVPEAILRWRNVRTTVGERIAATGIDLDVQARLAPVLLRENPGLALMSFLSGTSSIRGDVADFGFLNEYLRRLPGARLRGAGDLEAAVRFDRGALLENSRLSFRSRDLAFQMREVSIRGRGNVTATVSDGNEEAKTSTSTSTMRVHLDQIELEIAGEAERLISPGLTVIAKADVSDLTRGFSDLSIAIDLPESTISNLAGLGRAFPRLLPLSIDEKSAASLRIHAKMSETSAEGEVEIRANDLKLRFGNMSLRADTVASGRIGPGSSFRDKLLLPTLNLRIDRLSTRDGGEEMIEDWWADIRLEQAEVELSNPLHITGDLFARVRDVSPLTRALIPADEHRYLVALFNTDGLEGSARFTMETSALRLEDLRLSGHGLGRHFLGGNGFAIEAHAPLLDLERGLQGLTLNLEIDDRVLPGLDRFNELLPKGAGIRLLPGGTSRIRGSFRYDESKTGGRAVLEADDIRVEVPGTLLSADLKMEVELNDLDLKTGTIDVSGTKVSVSDLGFLDRGGLPDGWWAKIMLDEAHATLTRPFAIRGKLSGAMRDTKPLVAALAPAGRAGLNLEDLLDIADVNASARIRLDDNLLDFSDLTINGRGHAAGRIGEPGFSVSGTIARANFAEGLSGLALHFDLPRSRIEDLSMVNDYLPSGADFSFASTGDAFIAATWDLRDSMLWGEVHLDASQVDMLFGDLKATGDVLFDLCLEQGELRSQVYSLDGSEIRIENVSFSHSSSTEHEAWNSDLSLGESRVILSRPMHILSKVRFRMSDTRPLAHAFLRKTSQMWLLDLLDFQQVEASATVAIDADALTIDDFHLSGHSSPQNNPFGAELSLTAGGSQIKIGDALGDLRIQIDLPKTSLEDLSLLGRFVPVMETVHLLPGTSASVQGGIRIDGNQAVGRFLLDAPKVRFATGEAEIISGLALAGHVRSDDLTKPFFEIERLNVDFDDLSLEDDLGTIDSWWGKIRLERGKLRLSSPLGLDAHVDLTLRDSDPLVRVFARGKWLLRRIRHWLSVDHISGSTRLILDDGTLSFHDLRLSGDDIDVDGLLRFSPTGTFGFVYTKFHGLPLAFGLERDRRRIKIFRARRWYEKMTSPEPPPQ